MIHTDGILPSLSLVRFFPPFCFVIYSFVWEGTRVWLDDRGHKKNNNFLINTFLISFPYSSRGYFKVTPHRAFDKPLCSGIHASNQQLNQVAVLRCFTQTNINI